MPGGARERQLQGQLRPPLVEVRVGEGVSEDRDDVLQEHIDLVGRTDCPVGACYILVLPEGLTLSEIRMRNEWPCNNARAKRVRIVFCDRVWRDQPRGKTKGGAAPRGFFPRLIQTHEVGKTL